MSANKSDLRAKTLSGLGWNGAAQLLRQILQFVVSIILARLLSPADFGLIGMVLVFTGFAQIVSDLGLGAALIQKRDIQESHLDSVFWASLAVGLFLTILVIAVAPLISRFYDEPTLLPLTIVLSFNFAIGALNVVPIALFRREMAFRRIFWIQFFAVVVSGSLAVILAFSGFGAWALVIQTLFFTSASVALMWILSKWRPRPIFDWDAMKELLGFSTNLLGFNALNYWMRNLDNLLVGKYIGSAGLGIYSRAYSLMLLPVLQVNLMLTEVMFPVFSSIQNDIQRVKQIYLQSTRMIALAAFPALIGLFVVAESFVLALYGPNWAEMVPILRILCLAGLMQAIGTTVGWIYTSQGRTDLMFRWGIFAGLIRAVGFVIGLRWGLIGVAMSYLLSGYILWYPAWTIPGRLINLRFYSMIRNLSGVFLCGAGMGIGVWVIGLLLPSQWAYWAKLLVQVLSGIMIYSALVHLFRLKAYKELRTIVSEQRPGILRFARNHSKT